MSASERVDRAEFRTGPALPDMVFFFSTIDTARQTVASRIHTAPRALRLCLALEKLSIYWKSVGRDVPVSVTKLVTSKRTQLKTNFKRAPFQARFNICCVLQYHDGHEFESEGDAWLRATL